MTTVVGFGNPLLDTIVLIHDDSILNKYNLKIDGQKEVSADEMRLLKSEIENCDKTVTAGGCAQNTLKVMRWLLDDQCLPIIIGAVGGDTQAGILREILQKHGVETKYITQQIYSTGATVSLVVGEYRSLVACLGAAELLSVDDIKNYLSDIDKANMIYMEGFFLTKRIDVAVFILRYCYNKKKIFAFNLSGEYVCQLYPDTVRQFLEKSTIIFGNKREFQTLCRSINKNNVSDLIEGLSHVGKMIVMTDGPNSVMCKVDHDPIYEINVPCLKQEDVIDTTGAGDSFAAGFLAGYILKKDVRSCVKLGCYTAQEIIKKIGCLIPDYSPNCKELIT